MEWYLPITIIPGIGLLLLSTSNLLVQLAAEINTLSLNPLKKEITLRKIKQLKRLNYVMVFFYVTVSLLVIAGLLQSIFTQINVQLNIGIWVTTLGIVFLLIGLLNLVVYSLKAIQIRQDQYVA